MKTTKEYLLDSVKEISELVAEYEGHDEGHKIHIGAYQDLIAGHMAVAATIDATKNIGIPPNVKQLMEKQAADELGRRGIYRKMIGLKYEHPMTWDKAETVAEVVVNCLKEDELGEPGFMLPGEKDYIRELIFWADYEKCELALNTIKGALAETNLKKGVLVEILTQNQINSFNKTVDQWKKLKF